MHETAPVLGPQEQARIVAAAPTVAQAEERAKVLEAIHRRVAVDGPRTAWADDGRASQFAPFDALEGFSAMVRETIERSRREGE